MDGVVHPNVEQAIGRDRIRKALKRYENRPADEHRYGIVRSVNDDGSYEVLLDGDVQTSRCAQYGTALVGDRVLAVTKKDGRNDLIGRLGGEIGGGGGSVAGQIFAYAGVDEPSGALLCDGSAVSRLAYSELFAAIGTTYGEGNGSTTFNLPNLEGRVVVGESDDFALGSTGGEVEHSHKYAMKSNHFYGGIVSSDTNANDGLALWDYEIGDWVLGNTYTTNEASQTTNSALAERMQTTSSRLNNTEANTSATPNMPPYIALRWFISTGKGSSSGSPGGGSGGGSSSDADEKIAILEEALAASLKAKTWVFAIRDRGNSETQAGTSAASGWLNTTCGEKIAGTDDWEEYFSAGKSSTSITLKKPGMYRCTFRIHGRLSAAKRMGAGWFNGSTELASDWVYCGTTADAYTVVSEVLVEVESDYAVTPKIYVSGAVFTKYVGGHLTNFTIEYLGEL